VRRHGPPGEAERLRAAVQPDTPDFVRLSVDGDDLVIETTARSAASARATFEDLLPCLQAAERAASPAGGGRAERDRRP
jgi:hypothetical protein